MHLRGPGSQGSCTPWLAGMTTGQRQLGNGKDSTGRAQPGGGLMLTDGGQTQDGLG